MDIKEELKAIIDIELKPEFELAINEVIDKSYKDDIEKLGPDMASLVRSQWEQMKPYLFFAYCLGAKAQAVPEGFVLISAEQMSQWGHMANYAEEYGCPECYEARGYAHSLACEINEYFAIEAQEPTND